jgi:hypothetical protein
LLSKGGEPMAEMDILGMLGPEIIENMMQSIQEQDTPKMQ